MIDLYRESAGIGNVAITSARPLIGASVLRGNDAASALEKLSLLFRVCGAAQCHAGWLACLQALGQPIPAEVKRAQRLLVDVEMVREHLWHMMVAWPALINEKPSPSVVELSKLTQAWRNALFSTSAPYALTARLKVDSHSIKDLCSKLDALLAQHVFGGPLSHWQERVCGAGQFEEWFAKRSTVVARLFWFVYLKGWALLGNVETKFLLGLDEAWLHQSLQHEDADQFIAAPQWQNECCETTALSRHQDALLLRSLQHKYGKGLLTRLAARLIELVETVEQIKQRIEVLQQSQGDYINEPPVNNLPNVGLAQVEAARGRLIHRVVMNENKVSDYRILAPTEWNFHPQGIAAAGLKTLTGDSEEELKQQAALWINAIDPCVGYEVRVH
jgi:hypothetical protein